MRRLKTERNSRAMERKVRGAFRQFSHRRMFTTVFEHGQWWVILRPLERDREDVTYSVVDSEPGYGAGFDFERV